MSQASRTRRKKKAAHPYPCPHCGAEQTWHERQATPEPGKPGPRYASCKSCGQPIVWTLVEMPTYRWAKPNGADDLPPYSVRVATALWKYVHHVELRERVEALIAKRWPEGINDLDRSTWWRRLEGYDPCPFGPMDLKTIAAYVDCAIEWAAEHDS